MLGATNSIGNSGLIYLSSLLNPNYVDTAYHICQLFFSLIIGICTSLTVIEKTLGTKRFALVSGYIFGSSKKIDEPEDIDDVINELQQKD